jgi:hypothetical protein
VSHLGPEVCECLTHLASPRCPPLVCGVVSAFIVKAKELENFGMYEHRLTLVMLDRFLEGGGTSDDVPTQMYRHHLFDLRATLDKALMSVSSLDKTAQTTHMIAKGLTYRQVCTTTEEHWKRISDDNKWAPAKVKGDRKSAPNTFGAITAQLCQVAGTSSPRVPTQ